MPFKKVTDGLIENESYYTFASISNFLSSTQWLNQNGQFTLMSGTVERLFEHDNFVLVAEKANPTLSADDKIQMYIDGDSGKCVIEETEGETAKAWKLISIEGYLQAYATMDGTTWNNIGGRSYTGYKKQGFFVYGSNSLTVTKYSIYRNPFITVQGYTAGTKAQLYSSNTLIAEAIFDTQSQAQIFIHQNVTGILKISENGVILYESPTLYYQMGDTWAFVPFEIDVIYGGNILDWHTTTMEALDDTVIIKNTSVDTYSGVTVSVVGNTAVTLSVDGVAYADSVTIAEITPSQEITVYIHIDKPAGAVYGTNNFELEIKG